MDYTMPVVDGCKYPSLPDYVTINDILKKIYHKDYSEEELYSCDYMDLLEGALFKTFPEWYAKNIRTEQRSLRRQYKDVKACELCGSIAPLEVHHIKQVALGGGNERNNILFLCSKCHKKQKAGSSGFSFRGDGDD